MNLSDRYYALLFLRGNTAYELSMMIYKQGLECDAAARIIRATLPGYIESIKALTQLDMGKKYDGRKEIDWSRQFANEEEQNAQG